MIYNADINDIPLNVLIEVFTNDNHNIEFSIPTEDAVQKITHEYMNIVGGKTISAQLTNSNRVLNLMLVLECVTACENLVLIGKWKSVCEVLETLGYVLKDTEHEKIKKRVRALKMKAEYDLSKENKEEKPKEKPTKDAFTKERVFIMKYNKIQINPNIMTAAEYAWLVKQTCEEIDELNRKHKK